MYVQYTKYFVRYKINIEAKMDGYAFLSMDKGSLEQLGLSVELQTPLMKIIEDLVCHKHKLMQLYSYI